MSEPLYLRVYAYYDGKWESLVSFYDDFEHSFRRTVKKQRLAIDVRVVKLVSGDEISREKGLHTEFHPRSIDHINMTDVIWDRVGTMVRSVGTFLDLAVMNSGTQVLNYPVSIDESKSRDYILAQALGYKVPGTVFFPEGHFMRMKEVPGDPNRVEFDIGFNDPIENIQGLPAFFKRAHGGGRQHVYQVKNKTDLFNLYMQTSNESMLLQEKIEFDRFIRTFVFDDRIIHCSYDMEKPDGQKYSWPGLSIGDQEFLDKAMVSLAGKLLTPFCTMEVAHQKGTHNWYFIDITNGCNFDMRECELSPAVYRVVKQTLIDQLIDRLLKPRPIVVHTHLQAHVLKKQLFRAELKGQNPVHLLTFAGEYNIDLQGPSYEQEKKEYFKRYRQLHS